MGIVFSARDQKFNQDVAIKVLHLWLLVAGPSRRVVIGGDDE
jgi:hypothetical protein